MRQVLSAVGWIGAFLLAGLFFLVLLATPDQRDENDFPTAVENTR